MVKNYHECEMTDTATALQLRSQADVLLRRLVIDREMSERRLAESGQRDAIKSVTGRSALEDAIATTRSMIVEMDQLLGQADRELRAETAARTPRLACFAGTAQ